MSRGPGRPSLSGEGPSPKLLLPLPAALRDALREMAARTGVPVTEILRRGAEREVRSWRRRERVA